MSKKNRAPRLTRKERRDAQPSAMSGPLRIPESLRGMRATTTESHGLRPMSDVLEEFIEPLFAGQSAPSRPFVERAWALGAAVWNATAPSSSPAHLRETIAQFERMTGDPETARQVVSLLVQRRVDLFFDEPRTVVDVSFDWSGPEPRVDVASIVVPKGPPAGG